MAARSGVVMSIQREEAKNPRKNKKTPHRRRRLNVSLSSPLMISWQQVFPFVSNFFILRFASPSIVVVAFLLHRRFSSVVIISSTSTFYSSQRNSSLCFFFASSSSSWCCCCWAWPWLWVVFHLRTAKQAGAEQGYLRERVRRSTEDLHSAVSMCSILGGFLILKSWETFFSPSSLHCTRSRLAACCILILGSRREKNFYGVKKGFERIFLPFFSALLLTFDLGFDATLDNLSAKYISLFLCSGMHCARRHCVLARHNWRCCAASGGICKWFSAQKYLPASSARRSRWTLKSILCESFNATKKSLKYATQTFDCCEVFLRNFEHSIFGAAHKQK